MAGGWPQRNEDIVAAKANGVVKLAGTHQPCGRLNYRGQRSGQASALHCAAEKLAFVAALPCEKHPAWLALWPVKMEAAGVDSRGKAEVQSEKSLAGL